MYFTFSRIVLTNYHISLKIGVVLKTMFWFVGFGLRWKQRLGNLLLSCCRCQNLNIRTRQYKDVWSASFPEKPCTLAHDKSFFKAGAHIFYTCLDNNTLSVLQKETVSEQFEVQVDSLGIFCQNCRHVIYTIALWGMK